MAESAGVEPVPFPAAPVFKAGWSPLTATLSETIFGRGVEIRTLIKNENRIMNFDNSQVDYLAVYIEPLDKVVIYKAKDVKSKTELSLKI